MTDPAFDKFPVLVQVTVTIIASVAGIVAFFFGQRNKPTAVDDIGSREHDTTAREVTRLQQEALIDDLRRDMEKTITDVQRTLEKVVESASHATGVALEREVAELSDRINKLSERVRIAEMELSYMRGAAGRAHPS